MSGSFPHNNGYKTCVSHFVTLYAIAAVIVDILTVSGNIKVSRSFTDTITQKERNSISPNTQSLGPIVTSTPNQLSDGPIQIWKEVL